MMLVPQAGASIPNEEEVYYYGNVSFVGCIFVSKTLSPWCCSCRVQVLGPGWMQTSNVADLARQQSVGGRQACDVSLGAPPKPV